MLSLKTQKFFFYILTFLCTILRKNVKKMGEFKTKNFKRIIFKNSREEKEFQKTKIIYIKIIIYVKN